MYTDPINFITQYIKIQHPIRGIIPLALYDYQAQTILDYVKYDKICQINARQMGSSVVGLSFILWYSIINNHHNIIYSSYGNSILQESRNRLLFMIDNLPSNVAVKVKINNKQKIEFENGTTIHFLLINGQSGCGISANLVYMADIAYAKPHDQQDHYASVIPPMVSDNGKLIISSSIGTSCPFIQHVYESNTFHNIHWPWNLHPDRTEVFQEHNKKYLTDKQWRREFECEFVE